MLQSLVGSAEEVANITAARRRALRRHINCMDLRLGAAGAADVVQEVRRMAAELLRWL